MPSTPVPTPATLSRVTSTTHGPRHHLPPGYSQVTLAAADAAAAYEVYAASEIANAGELSVELEDIESDWARPSFDISRDAVAVAHEDRLVGAAEVSRSGTFAEVAVHPDHWGRGVGSWLEQWAVDRAADSGARTLAQHAPADSPADSFLLDRGYELSHTSWVLELPEGAAVADRALPEGYSIRTAVGEDVQAAYEVIQEAFGEWEGRERESYEDWRATIVDRPGTQPWQLRVITRDNTCVATAFTILDTWRNAYVQHLAVDRQHRGQGLAQVLLADAFRRAREHGAVRSELSTDSRTGALSLYEKVGMQIRSTWVNRVRSVRAAPGSTGLT